MSWSRQQLQKIKQNIYLAVLSLSDEDALETPELFPGWEVDTDYTAGYRVRYGGVLYRCEQSHRSQADWEPDVTPALWTPVAEPWEEWPEWRQPTGAQDAYNTGDKVSHNEQHWISSVDANVWEPGVYGWELAS